MVWIPAHDRSPDGELSVADALSYLGAQSLGSMDDAPVDIFVRTGPAMLDFVEAHSSLRFEIATGFPDYKPELPGGQPEDGRSLTAAPIDLNELDAWRDRTRIRWRRRNHRAAMVLGYRAGYAAATGRSVD